MHPSKLARAAAIPALLLHGLGACGGASASSESGAPAPAHQSENQPAAAHEGEHGGGHDGAHHGHQHGGHAPAGHPHDGPLVHRFEEPEKYAARWEGPARDAWQKPAHVVEVMQITPGMTVADLGTGTGYFVPHLSRAAGASGTVLALDIEESMVAYVTERATRDGLANVTAQQVVFDDPKLQPGSVDRILCVNTWHHIPNRVAYAGKLRAGLADGGALFIVDFTLDGKNGPPRESRLAPATVIAELRAAGFSADEISSTLTDQYVVKGSR